MKGKHRDAAAYELGVLDDPEEFETHLAGCPRCRDLLTGLGPVTAALEEAARLGYLPGGGGPPVSGGPAGAGSADHGSPASGDPAGAGDPVPGGSARQRSDAGGSYPPPGAGAARPASARTRFASAASIVSPAQVVAGTGDDLRDLPWSAGFQ